MIVLVRLASRQRELERSKKFILHRAESALGRMLLTHERVQIQVIRADDDQGWALRFAHGSRQFDFFGKEAVHTAHLVAPALNVEGGTTWAVDTAVREIELAGSPDLYFQRALKHGRWKYSHLKEYPDYMRIAFEMAAHEETERVALEGDLAQLEADWREAEEIASIADNMFIPAAVTAFIRGHRKES